MSLPEPPDPAPEPSDPAPDQSATAPPEQVWQQVLAGRAHRVEASGRTRRRVRWLVDGVQVAEVSSTQDKVRLQVQDEPDLGHLQVVFSALGAPRRATVHPAPEAGAPPAPRALLGVGGTDLEPAPGSRAAAYEQRLREHPTRSALVAGAGGAIKVVAPLVLGALAVLLVRWIAPLLPDLPSIPWPDLPSVPLPDLPSIPFPDLPRLDVTVPTWLRWLLERSQYVLPVVVALVLARREVRRRRAQDDMRARERDRDAG